MAKPPQPQTDLARRISQLEQNAGMAANSSGTSGASSWLRNPESIWKVVSVVILGLVALVYSLENSKITEIKVSLDKITDPDPAKGSLSRLEKELSAANERISYLSGVMSSLTGQTLRAKAEGVKNNAVDLRKIGEIVDSSRKGGIPIPSTDLTYTTQQVLDAGSQFDDGLDYWKTVAALAQYKASETGQFVGLEAISSVPSCLLQAQRWRPGGTFVGPDGKKHATPIRLSNCFIRLEETANLPSISLTDTPGSPDGKPVERTIQVERPMFIFDHAIVIYSTGVMAAGTYQFVDCKFDWDVKKVPSKVTEQFLAQFLKENLSDLTFTSLV